MTRTGGMIGVMQVVQIAPDGTWVYTDKRSMGVDRGQLAPAQRQQLAKLTSDPGLMREARMAPPPGECADGYRYVVAVGEASVQFDQCATAGSRPLTEQIIDLVVDATPL